MRWGLLLVLGVELDLYVIKGDFTNSFLKVLWLFLQFLQGGSMSTRLWRVRRLRHIEHS
jgi:hypothetical protein